jgi:single-strand DNA-binding protein
MYQNKVTLIGFLSSDTEVHTANNRSLTTFSLATRSSYKDKNSNQYISHTEWHRCVVFGKLSEFAVFGKLVWPISAVCFGPPLGR